MDGKKIVEEEKEKAKQGHPDCDDIPKTGGVVSLCHPLIW